MHDEEEGEEDPPHIASSYEERPGQVHYCIIHDEEEGEEEGEEEENFALYKGRLPQADEILLCRANVIPEPPQVIKYLFLFLNRSER